jgi:hypothetical protein
MKVKNFGYIYKKFNRNHWTPALTGACALMQVGVPYLMKHTNVAADAVVFI